MAYSTKIDRSQYNEVPAEVTREVIKVATEQSTILQMARRVNMPSHTVVMPVEATRPSAYWLNGATRDEEDDAFKQTTTMTWSGVNLVAAELAVLVPLDDNLIEDQLFSISEQLIPALGEAFGRKIDDAALWGDDKPALWSGGAGVGLYDLAVSAGNVVGPGTTIEGVASPDLVAQFGEAARLVAVDGFSPNGFVAQPGFAWRLRNMRTSTGESPYAPPLSAGQPATLYGEPFVTPRNGTWDNTRAVGMVADWRYAIVGIRTDMEIKIFDQGTITDGAGNVTYSAVQQDGKILRAKMRVAFATANPITPLNTNGATRSPFAFVTAASAPSS